MNETTTTATTTKKGRAAGRSFAKRRGRLLRATSRRHPGERDESQEGARSAGIRKVHRSRTADSARPMAPRITTLGQVDERRMERQLKIKLKRKEEKKNGKTAKKKRGERWGWPRREHFFPVPPLQVAIRDERKKKKSPAHTRTQKKNPAPPADCQPPTVPSSHRLLPVCVQVLAGPRVGRVCE